MGLPVDNGYYDTSGVIDSDGIIEHHQEEYYCTYRFECGMSFLDICIEMGIDSDNTEISMV